MKKVLVVLLVIAMFAGVFAACTKAEAEATVQPTEITTATEEPVKEAPTPTGEPDDVGYIPENMSPTTGLEDTTTVYKPVIVQIDNEPKFRGDQIGLQEADIVYETMIEGIDTRFTALFNDVLYKDGAAEKIDVGPVRSTRYYHQWIQSEWDALYVHNGGPDRTNNEESDIWGASSEVVKQRINGAGKHPVNSDMFYKGEAGRPISAVAVTDIQADAALYEYEPVQLQRFTFWPEEDYADAPEVTSVELSYWSDPGWAGYDYDAASDKLIRKMGGAEQTTLETGKPIEVQNLIVQHVSTGDMPHDGGRKKIDVFGEGTAEYVVHGKLLTGTWKRTNEKEATQYLLDDGTEVVLAPGNTWIAMHPKDRLVDFVMADGTEVKFQNGMEVGKADGAAAKATASAQASASANAAQAGNGDAA